MFVCDDIIKMRCKNEKEKNFFKNQINNKYKASMKNAIKKVEKAVASKDKQEAEKCLKVAIKNIDKATKNGVTSKNTCARNKSRLTKKVNEME